MHLRRQCRRNRKVLYFVLSGAFLFVWFKQFIWLQEDSYKPLTLSGIKELTNLHEERKPKQVFIRPNWKCKGHLRKNTVIMVLSKASNRLQRETIRQTWGNPRNQISYNFSLYFVIGNEKNVDFHKTQTENDDILHVDVDESYFSITEKVIEALNWAVLFCFDSRYLLKIDDDVYFNVIFLQKLNRNEQYIPDGFILGDCVSDTKPVRHSTKFTVSVDEYPFAIYPPYCGGPGYAMTLQTARKLYDGMTYTYPFKFEDAYVGIVAYKLGISIKKVDHFVYAMNGYFHRLYIDCATITHNLKPEFITELWNKRHNYNADKPDCSLSLWVKVRYALQNIFSLLGDLYHYKLS